MKFDMQAMFSGIVFTLSIVYFFLLIKLLVKAQAQCLIFAESWFKNLQITWSAKLPWLQWFFWGLVQFLLELSLCSEFSV